jgi:glyoxylase-like metal-dependent hydrolase (beta-lactamase superfamily II)
MSTPVSQAHASDYHGRRVPGPTEVVDGIWAVPVPLHFSPLVSITIFAIETSAGPVLIDAAYRHRRCWEAAQDSLARIGLPVQDMQAVLITHNHPDHVGFAGRVRKASGAPVIMHRNDDFAYQLAERGGFLEQLRGALDLSGAPADVVREMYDSAVKVAVHDESLVLDQQLVDERTVLEFGDLTITAVHTPGHTYGHTIFVDSRGVVFTGDTLMPEGPTQIAIVSRPEDDPTTDLLRSLETIAGLGATTACPAHQYPYTGVAERALGLRDFHQDEVDTVRRLLERHDTAWQVAPHLTWNKPWDELGLGSKRFALMHTLALVRACTG